MTTISPPLTVTIPGCQVGEQFVTYTIMVSKGESTWTVRRRYQDFVKLHTAIKKSINTIVSSSSSNTNTNTTLSINDIPELPPKKMRIGLSKFAPDFVEERRNKLELYLQKILGLINPEQVEALDDFLVYAEHWLREAIESLADVRELQQVVKLLRSAADAAAIVHQKRAGASGGAVKRRGGGDSDDEEEEEEAPPAKGANNANTGGDGPELLALLRDVVRMLREFAVMLRSQREDAEERGAATAASNNALNTKLRGKQEDIADARHMLDALRQARAKECEKERTQLVLVSQQVRTVAAELRRVNADTFIFQNTITNHTNALSNLRNILMDWEKGSLNNPFLSNNNDSNTNTTTTNMDNLPSLSPLNQIANLCERTETIQTNIQDLLSNTFTSTNKNISLPTKQTIDTTLQMVKNNSNSSLITSSNSIRTEKKINEITDMVNNINKDLVISGPALSVSLLMQSVTSDNIDLLISLQKIMNKQYTIRPLPVIPVSSQTNTVNTNTNMKQTINTATNNTNKSTNNTNPLGSSSTTTTTTNGLQINPNLLYNINNTNNGNTTNNNNIGRSTTNITTKDTINNNEEEVSAARLAVRAALAKSNSTNNGTPNQKAPTPAVVNTPGNPFAGFGDAPTMNNTAKVNTPAPTVKKGNPFA